MLSRWTRTPKSFVDFVCFEIKPNRAPWVDLKLVKSEGSWLICADLSNTQGSQSLIFVGAIEIGAI